MEKMVRDCRYCRSRKHHSSSLQTLSDWQEYLYAIYLSCSRLIKKKKKRKGKYQRSWYFGSLPLNFKGLCVCKLHMAVKDIEVFGKGRFLVAEIFNKTCDVEGYHQRLLLLNNTINCVFCTSSPQLPSSKLGHRSLNQRSTVLK